MKIPNIKMIALAAVIVAMLAINGCGSRAIVPASYNTYKAQDGSFKIQYPAEWEVESGGTSGYAWAKFTSGSAEITVDANMVGSIMADIARTHNPLLGTKGNEQDEAPVAAVHEQERQSFEEVGSIKEQESVPVQTGLSDARKSEYVGKKTFGGSIRGYRVTGLSSTKRIRIICQCPESEWEALKPAFDKVIQSVSMGTP